MVKVVWSLVGVLALSPFWLGSGIVVWVLLRWLFDWAWLSSYVSLFIICLIAFFVTLFFARRFVSSLMYLVFLRLLCPLFLVPLPLCWIVSTPTRLRNFLWERVPTLD